MTRTTTRRRGEAAAPDTAERLSDADAARVLELLRDADTVELKTSVPAQAQGAAIAGLPLDPVEAQPRQVFFFDTPDLALDKVGLLAKEKAFPITLSGGEQQRLAIARAVVHRPAILLADEPTGNLDAGHAADIGELFRSFHQVGVTVVIATHDEALAARLQPRIVALKGGAVVS